MYFDIVRKTDPFLPNFGDSLDIEVGDDDVFETEAEMHENLKFNYRNLHNNYSERKSFQIK